MDTVLGLILLVIYMAAIISFAAVVTWGVVKISPSKSQKQLEARRQAKEAAS